MLNFGSEFVAKINFLVLFFSLALKGYHSHDTQSKKFKVCVRCFFKTVSHTGHVCSIVLDLLTFFFSHCLFSIRVSIELQLVIILMATKYEWMTSQVLRINNAIFYLNLEFLNLNWVILPFPLIMFKWILGEICKILNISNNFQDWQQKLVKYEP